MDHPDIKSTMIYLKGTRLKVAAPKVNSGELAGLFA
jgi:integrase/recombinase XerD